MHFLLSTSQLLYFVVSSAEPSEYKSSLRFKDTLFLGDLILSFQSLLQSRPASLFSVLVEWEDKSIQ